MMATDGHYIVWLALFNENKQEPPARECAAAIKEHYPDEL